MLPSALNRPARSKSSTQRSEVFTSDSLDTEDSPTSPTSSDSSIDEDEVNRRLKPFWPKYQYNLRSRGFRLETVRDVKIFYSQREHSLDPYWSSPYYSNRPDFQDEDALCPDAGIPDNLFRGIRLSDSKRVVVKAVHAKSREYSVICALSRSPLRDDPMNHSIPVLDLFELPDDDIAFIVMEEWSSQLITSSGPCCFNLFLSALHQCIEHIAFMHKYHIAHLDISLRNLLTDYQGRYAYIDYELSRRFEASSTALVYDYRGTEVPPESERDGGIDPYKVDVWALAVLILRACKLTGYWVPELMHVIEPMLNEEPSRRPSSYGALQAFDKVTASLGLRVGRGCNTPH
ncbi:kinase-like domain-containing protein [Flammula alnicola]|nr:kinase-like domain-containing protein [Flammula alnicola]